MSQPDPYRDPTAYDQGVVPFSGPPAGALQPYSPAYPQAWPVGGQQYGRPPMALVSVGGRIGSSLLDFLLVIVTLGIGWWIWTLIVWSNGQTPAKQILGHVVADAETGEAFGWGRMFVRDFLIRGLLFGVVGALTAGILGLVDVLMVFREDRRTLHDMMAGSVVRFR